MYNLSYQSPQLRVAVIARTHYREVQTKAERNKLHVIEQKVLRHFRPLVAFTFSHNTIAALVTLTQPQLVCVRLNVGAMIHDYCRAGAGVT